jgi:aconitate hydratase
VVAYALAGTVDIDLINQSRSAPADGQPVYLKGHLADHAEVQEAIAQSVTRNVRERYADVFTGSEMWQEIKVSGGDLYEWDEDLDLYPAPAFLPGMTLEVPSVEDIRGARVLGLFRDSITTDHISPAGSIAARQPGRASTCRSTASNTAISTPTARGAATTGSWRAAPSPTSA